MDDNFFARKDLGFAQVIFGYFARSKRSAPYIGHGDNDDRALRFRRSGFDRGRRKQ